VASTYGWVTIEILSMVKRAHPLYSNMSMAGCEGCEVAGVGGYDMCGVTSREEGSVVE
jgi:hypothetical protein